MESTKTEPDQSKRYFIGEMDVFKLLMEILAKVNSKFPIVDGPNDHRLSKSIGWLTNGDAIDMTPEALDRADAFYGKILQVRLQYNIRCGL